jgi:hypothetical protein
MISEIHLYRKWYTKKTTIGELHINGKFFCYILEDVCRDTNFDGDLSDQGEAKVKSKTCIPSGRYQVIIDMSNRFKKLMPLLIGVAGFAGIRIHPGNDAVDTDGCLLTGTSRLTDRVIYSRMAYAELYPKLQAMLKLGKVFINIHDTPLNP